MGCGPVATGVGGIYLLLNSRCASIKRFLGGGCIRLDSVLLRGLTCAQRGAAERAHPHGHHRRARQALLSDDRERATD